MKKILTKDKNLGITTHFFGIEIAGTVAYFATAVIMFLYIFCMSKGDWLVSLLFPSIMIGLWFILLIGKVIEYFIKK